MHKMRLSTFKFAGNNNLWFVTPICAYVAELRELLASILIINFLCSMIKRMCSENAETKIICKDVIF